MFVFNLNSFKITSHFFSVYSHVLFSLPDYVLYLLYFSGFQGKRGRGSSLTMYPRLSWNSLYSPRTCYYPLAFTFWVLRSQAYTTMPGCPPPTPPPALFFFKWCWVKVRDRNSPYFVLCAYTTPSKDKIMEHVLGKVLYYQAVFLAFTVFVTSI